VVLWAARVQIPHPAPQTVDTIQKFVEFCKIDLQLAPATAYGHKLKNRKFFRAVSKNPQTITAEDIRGYLSSLKGLSASTYANYLKALKVFFRDFMRMEHVVKSFKFPNHPFKIKTIPTRQQLRKFYDALTKPKDKALFMLYASSGLRKAEILNLTLDNIDFKKRMITPNNHTGYTKKSWVSFYNEEAEKVLTNYFKTRKKRSNTVFPYQRLAFTRMWQRTEEISGVYIRPQVLRNWRCNEIANLGVQDRYVDAFCGRTPKSVLARHYTDYAPEKLKYVYDKANLQIFA
jgi:integrase